MHPELPQKNKPLFIYSNQLHDEFSTLFTTAIQKAEKSIHLVVYGLTDPAILHHLYAKAKENIDTSVYFDAKASLKVRGDFVHTYPIRSKGLMHQKILIIDHAYVFLGSANMTTTSLQMHDNLVLGIYSPIIARFLEKKTLETGSLHTFSGGQEIELFLLPDPRGHALFRLKEVIRSARKSLRIAMFTLTHPLLVDELIYAKRRGIQVTVIADFQSSLGASSKSLTRLKQENITIQRNQSSALLHHKFLLVDDRVLVTGSTNWTKAAFQRNHDCFVIVHPLHAPQKKTLEKLWAIMENDTKRW